jgi:hypothetical protein
MVADLQGAVMHDPGDGNDKIILTDPVILCDDIMRFGGGGSSCCVPGDRVALVGRTHFVFRPFNRWYACKLALAPLRRGSTNIGPYFLKRCLASARVYAEGMA